MNERYIAFAFYILAGYLSGSIMYAYVIPKVLKHIDIRALSDDGNPGTANAFLHAGIPIGMLVVLCELLKGAFPVWAAAHRLEISDPLFSLVLLAPVLGHAFPFLQSKKGGKAIAVSFGVLLGLFPMLAPALTLAALYILFSVVFVINPHFYRSVVAFLLFTVCCLFSKTLPGSVKTGCAFFSFTVILKHFAAYWGEHFCMKLPLADKLFNR